MRTSWPLVGRQAELATIADLLGRSDVRGIVLTGTSGVGKTRLAEECLRLAAGAGFATARVSATRAAATIPLGALVPLLPEAGGDGATGFDLLARAREAVLAIAAGRSLLVLVDDAHLLDDTSAALVHQVAVDASVFVVVTVRTGEPVPDPIVALWKDGHAERIDLHPLDQAACDELITVVLGGAVDGGSLRALWRACEGNPLVLRELLLGAFEADALVEERGVWRLRGDPPPSARLRELIEARLAHLDAAQRQAMELVALGEPVPVAILEAAVGLPVLAELEERGFLSVRVMGDRTNAWLAHPLHGEVLRATMATLRARVVRRTLAELTEATGARRRDDVMRVAMWRIDAGLPGSPEVLLDAALQANAVDDQRAAAKLARAAVAAGAGIEAAVLLGRLLGEQGEREEAERVLAEATDEAVAAGVADLERVFIAITRSDNLFWGLGRHEDAFEVVAACERSVTDPVAVAQLAAQRASFDLMLGEVQTAVDGVVPLLSTASGRAFVEASIAAEQALIFFGMPEQAIEVAERGFAAHLELGEQPFSAHPGIHVVAQAFALNACGRVREAEALAQMGYDAAAGIRRSAGQAWFAMILGQTAVLDGRVATAMRRFREGAAIFGELRHHGHRWCAGGVGIAAGMAGDRETAAWVLAELDAHPPGVVLLTEPDVLRGAAWCRLALGDPEAARAGMREAVELASRTGQAPLEVFALHDLARLGCAGEVVAPAAEAAARVEGPLAPLVARHVQAIVAGDAAGLDAVAEAFETAGLVLFAAEAFAEAAALHARAGDRRRADASARRSHELAQRCEGARTPALVQSHAPVPLTKREREIAVLAASGLASKVIAERLFLSTRTVDNHLQRVYAKLGVRSREALAEALGRG